MSRDPRYDEPADRFDERARDPADERARVDHVDDQRRVDERGRGAPRSRAGNWAATAALICGVVGLIALFMSPPLGLLLAVAAVILGIVGLAKARSAYVGGTAQAILGLVTGAIALLLTALLIWGITAIVQNSEFQQQLDEQIQEIQDQAGD